MDAQNQVCKDIEHHKKHEILKTQAEMGLKIVLPFMNKNVAVLFHLFFNNYTDSYAVFVDNLPNLYINMGYCFVSELISDLCNVCLENDPVCDMANYLITLASANTIDNVAKYLARYIHKTKYKFPRDEKCPVCYNDSDVYLTGPMNWSYYNTDCRCKQLICAECIVSMMEKKQNRCPFCRCDISEWYDSVKCVCDYLC